MLTIDYPNGASVAYVYGSSNIVRDGVGLYHFDYDANLAGIVQYRWFSTGLGQAAEVGQFKVI